jgi:hypothetical protein
MAQEAAAVALSALGTAALGYVPTAVGVILMINGSGRTVSAVGYGVGENLLFLTDAGLHK